MQRSWLFLISQTDSQVLYIIRSVSMTCFFTDVCDCTLQSDLNSCHQSWVLVTVLLCFCLKKKSSINSREFLQSQMLTYMFLQQQILHIVVVFPQRTQLLLIDHLRYQQHNCKCSGSVRDADSHDFHENWNVMGWNDSCVNCVMGAWTGCSHHLRSEVYWVIYHPLKFSGTSP